MISLNTNSPVAELKAAEIGSNSIARISGMNREIFNREFLDSNLEFRDKLSEKSCKVVHGHRQHKYHQLL